jgi:hypothetical protein
MGCPFYIFLRLPTLVDDPVELVQAGEGAACLTRGGVVVAGETGKWAARNFRVAVTASIFQMPESHFLSSIGLTPRVVCA